MERAPQERRKSYVHVYEEVKVEDTHSSFRVRKSSLIPVFTKKASLEDSSSTSGSETAENCDEITSKKRVMTVEKAIRR
eukprot:400116-Rhodomonas_salina.3